MSSEKEQQLDVQLVLGGHLSFGAQQCKEMDNGFTVGNWNVVTVDLGRKYQVAMMTS